MVRLDELEATVQALVEGALDRVTRPSATVPVSSPAPSGNGELGHSVSGGWVS